MNIWTQARHLRLWRKLGVKALSGSVGFTIFRSVPAARDAERYRILNIIIVISVPMGAQARRLRQYV